MAGKKWNFMKDSGTWTHDLRNRKHTIYHLSQQNAGLDFVWIVFPNLTLVLPNLTNSFIFISCHNCPKPSVLFNWALVVWDSLFWSWFQQTHGREFAWKKTWGNLTIRQITFHFFITKHFFSNLKNRMARADAQLTKKINGSTWLVYYFNLMDISK